MLSYQHAYHAGNHADILKHFVLTFTLAALNKKDKPYTFFDTHAASGLYDLLDNRSLKTGEAEAGIKAIFEKENFKNSLPELCQLSENFENYITFVKKYLEKSLYPGSPEIERCFMRNGDFLILSELHPQEVINLKENIRRKDTPGVNQSEPIVQVHNKNGFEVLNAFTPPKTKRGAVLIDPSYEESSDYTDVSKSIIQIHKKWSNGIIMLWYPLLLHREAEINNMLDSITAFAKNQNPNTEICNLQLLVNSKDSHKEVSLAEYEADKKNPPRLYGSGMFIINAPWHLAEEGKMISEKLQNLFFHK